LPLRLNRINITISNTANLSAEPAVLMLMQLFMGLISCWHCFGYNKQKRRILNV